MGRGRKYRRNDAGASGAPYNLRDAINDIGAITATCRRCRHQRMLLPLDLAQKLGEDFPIDRLHSKLRCTACRKLGAVRVEVAWRD
jgi:hypothetical protein